MKKLKAFAYVYIKSLTNFPYYRDILKTRFAFSVKYFLFLALVLSFLSTIGISIKIIPEMSRAMGDFISKAETYFPEDLVFTIKNGVWSVNRPEPFIVPFPEVKTTEVSVEELAQIGKTPKNLIVFWNTGTIEDLTNLDTLVLVNKVNVIYKEGNKISVLPVKELPDTVIDKTEFNKVKGTLTSIFKVFPILFVCLIFLGSFIVLVVGRSIHFLIEALVIWLISLITGVKLGYQESLRIAVHSATLPLSLAAIFNIFDFVPFLFWFAILNTLFALFVLLDMAKYNKDVPQPLK